MCNPGFVDKKTGLPAQEYASGSRRQNIAFLVFLYGGKGTESRLV
jgi:hypothetical protein